MVKVIVDFDDEISEGQEELFNRMFDSYELVEIDANNYNLSNEVIELFTQFALEEDFVIFVSENGLLMSLCKSFHIGWCFSFYSEVCNEWVFI